MQHFYFSRSFTISKFFFTNNEIKTSLFRIKYQVDCIQLIALNGLIVVFGYSCFQPVPMAVSHYITFKAGNNVMHNMLPVHPLVC